MPLILGIVVLAVLVWLVGAATRPGSPRPATSPAEDATNLQDPDPVALAGGDGCDFDIVGESFHQDSLRQIAGVDPDGVHHHCIAIFIRELENLHDPHAVAVWIDAMKVGYLSRDHAVAFNARLRELGLAGRLTGCRAYVCGGWRDDRADEWASYGVKLALRWPIEVESAGPMETFT